MTKWNFNINVEKSRVVIFNKYGKKILRTFFIGNQALKTSNKYTYFRIEMTSNGNVVGVLNQIWAKSTNYLCRLKRTIIPDTVDIHLNLDFFEKRIAPICLY